MKVTYTFTVLRYVHDITTEEFVNVGVAVYCPEAKYLSALCTTRYARASRMFLDFDASHFRSLMHFIQSRFEERGGQLHQQLLFDSFPTNVIDFARSILPVDDSSLQWSTPGSGLTLDPEKTLEYLFATMVQRYEERPHRPSREDQDVWKPFKRELEKRRILAHLRPKRIVAKDDDYEFEHARKNEIWHAYEPMSFDLIEAESIIQKANRWLGRSINLQESKDKFKLYLLLGEPRDDKLRPAYVKAKNILHKMPGKTEFVSEHEADSFSEDLANDIKQHSNRD
jgi:hypothetical protein